jgi:hypothetical protein
MLPPDLAAAVDAVNRQPGNLDALLTLGGLAHDYGEHEQAAKVREHLVQVMAQGIELGRATPDLVANLQLMLYNRFVKKIETEAHARACFQSWLAPIVTYGRRFRDTTLPRPLWQPTAERPWRTAFLLYAEHVLGHTEALLELLNHRPAGLPWHDQPIVYVLNGSNEALDALVARTGARIVNVDRQPDPPQGFTAKMQWLRRHMDAEGVSHFVWVSAPATAPYAMAMKLAPVQVFWTLKFHPFQIPDIDGFITYGAWSEQTRRLHGQEDWQVVPFMMSKPSGPVDPARVAETRARFAQHDILFGTLARTEKMNSRPFLDAVVRILRDHPKAGFLWAGRERLQAIQMHFDQAGVAGQCHFIGWVETPLYARVLDVFLECFPFGCGLTGIQALEAGTAFLSFAAPETQYGMHFLRPLQTGGAAADEIRRLLAPGADGRAPLLYANDADEYVALAAKLASDAAFRAAAGAAGQAYYRHYLTDSDGMGRRFMQSLADLKKPEAGTS